MGTAEEWQREGRGQGNSGRDGRVWERRKGEGEGMKAVRKKKKKRKKVKPLGEHIEWVITGKGEGGGRGRFIGEGVGRKPNGAKMKKRTLGYIGKEGLSLRK